MRTLVDCLWCKTSFRTTSDQVTVFCSNSRPCGAFGTKCVICDRNLFWQAKGNMSSQIDLLLAFGAPTDILELSEQDLSSFRRDLATEDFLSEVANYECYS